MKRAVSFEQDHKKAPWLEWNSSPKGDLPHSLSQELKYIEKWLKPTEIEEKTRLLTIEKFSNIIETHFPPSSVIVQGSSATETYLPTSDIDLIVTNLSKNEARETEKTLKNITKLLWKHKIIVNGFIIPFARVPLIKCVDRCYGYRIDICISNVNGVLNVPRVQKILSFNPMLRTVLIFMKLFVYLYDIDDPATGGFGSNHLLNMVLFAFQSFSATHDGKEPENEGEILLYLMDIIANKINFFLCGVSTISDGYLFSKLKSEQLDCQCPIAFVFEDPQLHDVYFGMRTRKTNNLRLEVKKALTILKRYGETSTHSSPSPISSFLPPVFEIENRRRQIGRAGELLDASPYEFSRSVSLVSSKTWAEKNEKKNLGFKNRVIQVSPDPEPAFKPKPIPRSMSSPTGFEKKKIIPQKSVWGRKAIKDDATEVTKPSFAEIGRSWSFHRIRKYKK